MNWIQRVLGGTDRRHSDGQFLQDWFGFGSESATGLHVNHRRALMLPAVWQALNMIAGDLAQLPLHRYERVPEWGEDGRRRVMDSTTRLINRKPNPEVNDFQLWSRFWSHRLLYNRAYLFLDRRGGGRIEAVYNLLPDRTYPTRIRGTFEFVSEVGGQIVYLDPEEVFTVQGLCFDNLDAIDLISAARDAFGLALAAQDFASKYFANGCVPTGILEIPHGMEDPAKKNLEDKFRKQYTSRESWFKTIVLRDGAKFHSVQIDANKSQQHELREDQVREVARVFNLQPSRLGLSDSVSYNSKSEDNRAYLSSTLAPHLAAAESEADVKFLPEENFNDFWKHDTSDLLRMNAKERHQIYQMGSKIGMYSPDDARAGENLPPRSDGLGGVYQTPLNMGPAETVLGGGEEEEETAPAAASTGEERAETAGDVARGIAIRRWLHEFTGRARHKAGSPAKFCEWVDTNFKYHRARLIPIAGPIGDEIVDRLHGEINAILDETEPAALRDVVGAWTSELEAREAEIIEEVNECVLS